MIASFADARTEDVYNGLTPKGLPSDILKRARAKLVLIAAVAAVEKLRVPPSNRLEKLSGDREGQWSIRINDQWRICFVWKEDNNAYDVEIVDYH
ncbi:MAG: type II toxin-antitoxin system RelE/ParE family toxin [Capsulimonadaceae bacterium]